MTQEKQAEWHEQWSLFRDNEEFLFRDWIYPLQLTDLRGKRVLEAGCGGGQHTAMMAPFAESITAVDLNTIDLAQARCSGLKNVGFVQADIAAMKLDRRFDVVLCVGVIHHTNDPDATFANLVDHVQPGGTIAVWAYSSEGNFLVRYVVEPIRALLLRHLPRRTLIWLSKAITALMYPVVHTIYRLPLSFLPYYEYFENFRRLSFERNVLNVFDKLNAPHTDFITRKRVDSWLSHSKINKSTASVRHYAGVSWGIVARVAA